MASISRKAAILAGVILVPIVLLVTVATPNGVVRLLACLWGMLGLAIAWLTARSLRRRIGDLQAFADRMPDLRVPRPHLMIADDELGELARSLTRLTPKIEEVLKGLSTELARREVILGSMTEAVVAVDAKLNVSFCNDAFVSTVANHSVPEGVPLIKVLRDPGLLQLLQRVIASGETIRHRLHFGGREERSFEVYATPLVHDSAPGALSILHDVTPIERLERTKRDFVANVSHEFRTPLATITGYAETLLNGGLEDEGNRRKFVEIIQANSVRLNNIATDLITLSEVEGGRPATEPEAIPVDDVIQSAMSTMEPVARMHQVQLRTDATPGLEVRGHRFRFEHALLNLLDNAIKFNKPDGEVCLRARLSSDSSVEIRVADTGIGIPREDLSRIFERFYRVDKARSRQVGGTGLGLSIVRHAIEQMEGAVQVESELGTGSCFIIRLPRCQRAQASS
jgi:two-component system, OmpR family, phosphate regulon sensor histidine kinase PhoR